MELEYHTRHNAVDWPKLRSALIEDDFHNGRSAAQLKRSFENSQIVVYVSNGEETVATARALSDFVCNCYVVDVWTRSDLRNRGIARHMMNRIIESAVGQHIYLQSDDAVPFYRKLGFTPQPEGLALVSGEWLANDSANS